MPVIDEVFKKDLICQYARHLLYYFEKENRNFHLNSLQDYRLDPKKYNWTTCDKECDKQITEEEFVEEETALIRHELVKEMERLKHLKHKGFQANSGKPNFDLKRKCFSRKIDMDYKSDGLMESVACLNSKGLQKMVKIELLKKTAEEILEKIKKNNNRDSPKKLSISTYSIDRKLRTPQMWKYVVIVQMTEDSAQLEKDPDIIIKFNDDDYVYPLNKSELHDIPFNQKQHDIFHIKRANCQDIDKVYLFKSRPNTGQSDEGDIILRSIAVIGPLTDYEQIFHTNKFCLNEDFDDSFINDIQTTKGDHGNIFYKRWDQTFSEKTKIPLEFKKFLSDDEFFNYEKWGHTKTEKESDLVTKFQSQSWSKEKPKFFKPNLLIYEESSNCQCRESPKFSDKFDDDYSEDEQKIDKLKKDIGWEKYITVKSDSDAELDVEVTHETRIIQKENESGTYIYEGEEDDETYEHSDDNYEYGSLYETLTEGTYGSEYDYDYDYDYDTDEYSTVKYTKNYIVNETVISQHIENNEIVLFAKYIMKHKDKAAIWDLSEYNYGTTLLYLSAYHNRVNIALLLLELNKATAQIINEKGWLPIHRAVERGNLKMINLLSQYSCILQPTKKQQDNVLHIAIKSHTMGGVENEEEGKIHVLKYILSKKHGTYEELGKRTCNLLKVRNNAGLTPLQLAVFLKYGKIREFLENFISQHWWNNWEILKNQPKSHNIPLPKVPDVTQRKKYSEKSSTKRSSKRTSIYSNTRTKSKEEDDNFDEFEKSANSSPIPSGKDSSLKVLSSHSPETKKYSTPTDSTFTFNDSDFE
ncbi:hypothetical protein SNEBB_005975 [Seison nebaliae]|nr:hypothetical protein SNEBB_005975 [Seison nebaliae]